VYHTLVVALVLSGPDYGNAVLTSLPVQPSAVSAKRCRAIHRRIRRPCVPHHCHTRQFPLVEGPGACSVQAGDNRLSFTEWYGSTLPGCRSAPFVRQTTSRRRLRSSLTDHLDVRQSQCSSVQLLETGRLLRLVGARLWNSLPLDVVACDTLSRFRRELKTFLFRQSHPSIFFSRLSLWSLLF